MKSRLSKLNYINHFGLHLNDTKNIGITYNRYDIGCSFNINHNDLKYNQFVIYYNIFCVLDKNHMYVLYILNKNNSVRTVYFYKELFSYDYFLNQVVFGLNVENINLTINILFAYKRYINC